MFNQLRQSEGELFNEFLLKVRTQAKRCDFRALNDELTMDRMIAGIHSDKIREKLLTTDELKLDKAIALCIRGETATKQLTEIRTGGKSSTAETAVDKNRKVSNIDCKRRRHEMRNCPAFTENCSKCNRRGHYAKMCFSSKGKEKSSEKDGKREKSKPKAKNGKGKSKKVDAVTDDENTSDELHSSDDGDDEVFVYSVTDHSKDDWIEDLTIGDKKLRVKLDTGAQCTDH